MKIKSLIFLLTIVLFIGCKKAEEPNENNQTTTNVFSLDGTKYNLTKGFLADGSIGMFSDGLTITGIDPNNGDPIIQGAGNLIVIREITGQSGIVTGTYTFPSTEGLVGLNYNFANNTNDYAQWINEGEGLCTINISNLEYEIKMDGTLNDGKKILAYFKGTMINIIQ
ncbi:MAG: hypothetical protein K8R68_10025 [Bacteroidales bacterium]|nr:hypothetical protein [Bacteroidales bacterium]